jgi:hypothetical protein
MKKAIVHTMKLNFDSLEVKRKINLLAEICHYGIQWNSCLPDTDKIMFSVALKPRLIF